MTLYIFFRSDMWYPIELRDDDDARKNAECNPGTTRVDNAITGEVVWMPSKELNPTTEHRNEDAQ